MARYTGPKQKLQRQIGEDLGLKTNALKTAKRINVRPGQHGAKRRRRPSDYGLQLAEKQKVKYIYGILEKPLRKLYEKADQAQGGTGPNLLAMLERRLDNVIYRLGWAPTRAAARQLVAHNHVKVNNRKMNIPSYLVKEDDLIKLKDKSTNIPQVQERMADEGYNTPEWLERKHNVAKVLALPERDQVEEKINEQLIVEFYSR
ncbi:MAG: 30S ribosomal protein S4 [Candidatus Pacebacteria bacterium]|nr:30S ribosomal protein S4 [Candidatus Paceibacterota bacterium]